MCNYATTAKTNKHIQLFYNMDDAKLRTVTSEKDLGVITDNELSFKEHIHLKVKKEKENALVGMLKNFRASR